MYLYNARMFFQLASTFVIAGDRNYSDAMNRNDNSKIFFMDTKSIKYTHYKLLHVRKFAS